MAVVSGRRAEQLAGLLDISGVRYEGLYGLQGILPESARELRAKVRAVASRVSGAWVEDKGLSLAVHYRGATDPAEARAALLAGLGQAASEADLELVWGKMVVELLPAGLPRKGGVVEEVAAAQGLQAVLFAGDDVADVDAFAALGRMAERGLLTLKVAVRGEETPDDLLAAADLVVDGPAGLVGLLRQLA